MDVEPDQLNLSKEMTEESLNVTVDELVCSYLSKTIDWDDPWEGNDRITMSTRSKNSSPKLRKRMLMKLEEYIAKWNLACRETSFAKESFDTLLAFHLGETQIAKSHLQKHLVSLAELFRNFAFQVKEFKMLSKADQRRLLVRNTPIYIQYFCGRYFNAKTGLEQFQWLFPFKLPENFEAKYGERLREKVPFPLLNKMMKFFDDDEHARLYMEMAAKLDDHPLFLRCHASVALSCLFTTSQVTVLDDADTVQGHLVDFYNFADWTHEVLNCSQKETLATITRILEKMTTAFEMHVSWNEVTRVYHDISSAITLPFTQEEDCWLARQFDRFDRSFHEVSFGEEILKEFIMFGFDVPPSRTFLPRLVAVLSERFRKIMKLHDEFISLSDLGQALLWQTNVMSVVVLCLSKVEHLDTGDQQLRFCLGYLDGSIFKQNYENVIDQSKLRRMTIFSFEHNRTSDILTKGLSNRIHAISSRLSDRVKNVETFKLLVFITMFSQVSALGGTPGQSPVQSLRQVSEETKINMVQKRYMTIFRRKLQTDKGGEETISQFNSTMADIKELAQLIKLVITSNTHRADF